MNSLVLSLKNCPLCGKKHPVIVTQSAKRNTGPFYVWCFKCNSSTENLPSPHEAAKVWNSYRRVKS